jgi:hypothetical protein
VLIDAPYLVLAILAAAALGAIAVTIVLNRSHSLTRQLSEILTPPNPPRYR